MTPDYNELSQSLPEKDITQLYLIDMIVRENPDEILRNKDTRDLRVYEKIKNDDQVKSVFQQRRSALTSREWEVIPNSESPDDIAAADFITEQLRHINFDDKTDKMMWGLFYGYSVAECIWGVDGDKVILEDIKVRKARRFKFGYGGELRLLTRTNPFVGEAMPEKKFWVFSTGDDNDDNPYGEGLAKSLYYPVFFKKNGVKFWMVFLEKFGSPTAKGEFPRGASEKEKKDILDALDAIQTETSIALPTGTTVELLEASRSGTADYATLTSTMNSAIAKIILSQTMTTDSGSSYSQSKVHDDVKDEVVKADSDLICESFNNQVIKWLMEWNFPSAGMPKVWRKVEPAVDTEKLSVRDKTISEIGYKPTLEYITQTYGEGFELAPQPKIMPPIISPSGKVASFSESELVARMLAHRKDQDDIANAAYEFGQQYDSILGDRVNGLLSLAKETGDLSTFRDAIDAMFEEIPTDKTIESVARAGIVSRLMGLVKGHK